MYKYLKRILIWTIVFVMLIFAICYSASKSNKAGDKVSWRVEDKTLIFSGSGAMYNYKGGENSWDVLQYKNGKKNPAFDNIVFEDGITSIGSFTFDNNLDVKTIKFPSTLKRIEDYAFCIYALDELVLPNSLEYLGIIPGIEGVFMKSVIMPVSIKKMGDIVDLRDEYGDLKYIYFKGQNVNEKLFDEKFKMLTFNTKEVRYNADYFDKFINEYPDIKFVKISEEENIIKPDYNYISMDKALQDIGTWSAETMYTYNAYNQTDFKRGNATFSSFNERFKHDYSKASPESKVDREIRIASFNEINTTYKYSNDTINSVKDYNIKLESFKDHIGEHALYPCTYLAEDCYKNYKMVSDDCSSNAMAVWYYATKGDMDKYAVLNIYELGGGKLLYASVSDATYKALNDLGFERIPVNNATFDELQSGDLLVSNNHYEFYYITEDGEKTSFAWGSVKSRFPNLINSIEENEGKGFFKDKWVKNRKYKYIYRLVGGSKNNEK